MLFWTLLRDRLYLSGFCSKIRCPNSFKVAIVHKGFHFLFMGTILLAFKIAAREDVLLELLIRLIHVKMHALRQLIVRSSDTLWIKKTKPVLSWPIFLLVHVKSNSKCHSSLLTTHFV